MTRVAALYDVHGNLPALESALADVERDGPDLVVFGGDVASGPFPAECVELLASLRGRASFLAGNVERALLGDDAAVPEHVREDIARTRRLLSEQQLSFVRSWETAVSLEVQGLGTVLFCHGLPPGDEAVVTEATPDAVVAEFLDGLEAGTVVVGHTHMHFERTVGGVRVVNAGSIGMPYADAPGAYWASLGPRVELRRTDYDLERAAELTRATDWSGAAEFAAENILTVPSAEEATEVFERRAGRR